ncbi:MAG: type II toxin-antitoxin system HicB family antitoxin [Patescibacteria group bacterium]
MKNFTAVYKKHGRWYLGWVEEIPGINTQGRTIREVKENLREAAKLVFETNRALVRGGLRGKFIKEALSFR